MAFKFWNFFQPKNGRTASVEINCKELFDAAQDFQARLVALNVCVDMIANAISRCEFKTYTGGVEEISDEYYLWNYEPNYNQNSSEFLHKLIYKLCTENEALVINTTVSKKKEMLFVADEWDEDNSDPTMKPNEYKNVTVGDRKYERSFTENEVLHFKLNNKNIYKITDSLFKSYCRLISTAARNYQWRNGQHWKVHVSQVAAGGEDFMADFQKMLEAQIKPFLDSNGAILPEFDGYDYQDVGRQKGGSANSDGTRDVKTLIDDIFEMTARTFQIPAVLVLGQVEGTSDANNRFLTYCIDPICDQLSEEATRKRYGYKEWKKGNYLRVDTSSIIHFDIFANAANVEKLVGSGAFTINDIRRAANQPEINEDWANKFFMTKNIAPLLETANAQS